MFNVSEKDHSEDIDKIIASLRGYKGQFTRAEGRAQATYEFAEAAGRTASSVVLNDLTSSRAKLSAYYEKCENLLMELIELDGEKYAEYEEQITNLTKRF